MSKDKDPEVNGLAANGVANGNKMNFEMKIYPKPSAKDIAAARPCRLFIVFTFILFLVGFLIASIALLAITEKCNKRGKAETLLPSRMQYQINVRSFMDSDANGVGDINGVTSKLSYVKSLGADSLLLSDVISENNFEMSTNIGTEEDLRTLVSSAKEMEMGVYLQMNAFTVTRKYLKQQCSPEVFDVTNCPFVITRRSDGLNDWKNTNGDSAWNEFEFDDVPGMDRTKHFYYSYYGRDLPALNLQDKTVMQLVQEKINEWLTFGVRGFVLTDVSRLTVEQNVSASTQLDQDHPLSRDLLSQLYDFVRGVGGELWVIPSTFLTNTLSYLGTTERPLADQLIADQLALQEQRINIDGLNNTLSTVMQWVGQVGGERIGWQLDGPRYSRLASRVKDRRQAELMSLLLLTLPNQIVAYYGDERLLEDLEDGRSTASMVFDDKPAGFSYTGPSPDNTTTSAALVRGFSSLAELRTKEHLLTGTPRIVHAKIGVLVMLYENKPLFGKKSSSLVFVNFNMYNVRVRGVNGCVGDAEVVFAVGSGSVVGEKVDCSEVSMPGYGMFVAKLVQ